MATMREAVRDLTAAVDELLTRDRAKGSFAPPPPAEVAAPVPASTAPPGSPEAEEAAELIRRALRRLRELG